MFLCIGLQTVFLCQPSCLNWHKDRNIAPLVRSGRVRTNLYDILLSVTMLQNIVHCMVRYLILNQILDHFVCHLYITLCKTVHVYLLQLAPMFREAFSMQPLVASGAYCSGSSPPLLCAADSALGLLLFRSSLSLHGP
jgi:hypothetical protein